MDILKKIFMTAAVILSFGLFAACNSEIKPEEKEVVATYVSKTDALTGLTVKIDFYSEGNLLIYADFQSAVLIDLYKGAYEGKPAEDGTLKIKITEVSDAADALETDKFMDEFMPQILAKIESAGKDAKLPLKLDVKWSSYEGAKKSFEVVKGKLSIEYNKLDADFARVGSEAEKELNSGNPEITPPADDDDEDPENGGDPVVPPADGSDDDDPADTEKTIVANYTSKKDIMTGLIMKVDFYSDGTWLAYDDIRVGETSGDENGNTESTDSSLLYVDLYKGTYTGKPAEDGKFAIVTTHNTYISNLRSISTIEKYYEEIEKLASGIGKDAVLPVRLTDTWLSTVKVETEVKVSDGKINLFDTDLYKDGKYEEEPSGNQNEPETSEESKEVAARFLGKDDVGNVFIELYTDNSFLAYDIVNLGKGISMKFDLYKGSYRGKPAEDGFITFNITHRAKLLDNNFESQFDLLEKQLMEAGENPTYPVKYKDEWNVYTQYDEIFVKNGRANVLKCDVVREGVSDEPSLPESNENTVPAESAAIDDAPLFDSAECTVPVNTVVLADGKWTMKIITDDNEVPSSLKTEEKNLLLEHFSGSDKESVEALITKENETEFNIFIPVESMIQAVTYILELNDNSVSALNGANSYSNVVIKDSLYKEVFDYMERNIKGVLYDWHGDTGSFIKIMSENEVEMYSTFGMGQIMLDNALEQKNWKSNSDGTKYLSIDRKVTIYLEKE